MSALLPLGLAFLMFVVGLRLTVGDLCAIVARPKALATGLAVQVVALPALALALGAAFDLPAPLAAGLLVVAAAPGGITSNYAALLARADAALSTAMTLATSLAAFLTVPLALRLGGVDGGASFGASTARLSLAMFVVSAAPLAAGLALRRFAPAFVARRSAFFDRIGRIVFAAIVLATFWENRAALVDHAGAAGPATVALNLGAIGAGWLAARSAGLPRPQRFAIVMETGLQNVALAIFVATSVLGRSDLTIPALLYAVVMNVSALALIAAGRRGRLTG
ncbi:MAG: bile acid:sodium symporter [Rhizobiales bacterium]|nr:bile acid:sodium symporter [Hyphomicrobiales bacterium]